MAVLVVDDDATVVNLVTAVLHRAGIDAEVALDGAGALLRLDRGRYRAVLSDLTMPGMSGLQLLREARARGHALPFLIMTAYLVPEAESALRAEPGVAGVLRKPFDIKRLVSEVHSLLVAAGMDPAGVLLAAAESAAGGVSAIVPAQVPESVPQRVPDTVAAELDAASGGVTEPELEPAFEPASESTTVSASVSATVSATVSVGPAALLPLSLLQTVTARIRRQALIAQAERRAAALIARGPARPRAAEQREAVQGC